MGSICETCGDEFKCLYKSHYYKKPSHKPNEWPSCPDCGERYKRLGGHWKYNPTHRPELSNTQHKIVTGLLMGDGHIKEDSSTSYLQVNMTNRRYLEMLNTQFGCLSTNNIHLAVSAKKVAEQTRESEFSNSATEDSCKDVYNWRTRNHPIFNEYRQWYSSGKKVFPSDIELSPTVLKHWYCSDGNINTSENRGTLRIGVQSQKKERIEELFSSRNLPEPSWDRGSIWFTVDDSEKMYKYMGDAPDGFEYKWPKRLR